MRSFHGTVEAGAESDCVSLGFSKKEEVDVCYCFICTLKSLFYFVFPLHQNLPFSFLTS